MNNHYFVSLLLWALPLAVSAQVASTDSLLAYWKFDETTGTVAYDTASNNDATLNSGASFNPGGQSKGALQIDAFSGVADAPVFHFSGNTMTISCWVRPTNTSGGANRRILTKYKPTASGGSTEIFAFSITSNKGFEAKFSTDGSSSNAGTATNALKMDTWSHIAATYNGSSVKLYLNGTEIASAPASGNLIDDPNAVTGIGNRPTSVGTDQPFYGLIDELRIYNRTLTASEISTLSSPEASNQLPVTFTAFSATPLRSGVALEWRVEDQVNNAGFAVERAVDQQAAFTEIGFVAAHAHGRYSFTDQDAPAGTVYYRLRQEDFDGTVSYSDLVHVAGEAGGVISVYPNPTADVLTIRGSGGDYLIMDTQGRRVGSGRVEGLQSVSVSGLPSGTYTIWVDQKPVRFVKR